MKETLNLILQNVEGCLSAIIMAYDGIPIDECSVEQSDFDTQLLSVEYANVLKEIKRAVDVIKAGDLEEVTISTSRTRVIMRVLTDELFVALILKSDGNAGKGQYLLKMKSRELSQELV